MPSGRAARYRRGVEPRDDDDQQMVVRNHAERQSREVQVAGVGPRDN
jgi:hypothetical protein